MFASIQVSEMYGARRINDNRTNDLTLPVPYIFTSFSSLKRFYEGLKGTTKKCENKNLI